MVVSDVTAFRDPARRQPSAVVARYFRPAAIPGNGPGSNMVSMVLWTDPNPIVPGLYYDINIQSMSRTPARAVISKFRSTANRW